MSGLGARSHSISPDYIHGENDGADGAPGAPGDPGVVQEVQAGANIVVDNTDPANPIVSSTASGGLNKRGQWAGGEAEYQEFEFDASQTIPPLFAEAEAEGWTVVNTIPSPFGYTWGLRSRDIGNNQTTAWTFTVEASTDVRTLSLVIFVQGEQPTTRDRMEIKVNSVQKYIRNSNAGVHEEVEIELDVGVNVVEVNWKKDGSVDVGFDGCILYYIETPVTEPAQSYSNGDIVDYRGQEYISVEDDNFAVPGEDVDEWFKLPPGTPLYTPTSNETIVTDFRDTNKFIVGDNANGLTVELSEQSVGRYAIGAQIHGRATQGETVISPQGATVVNVPVGASLTVREGGTWTLKNEGTDNWVLMGDLVSAGVLGTFSGSLLTVSTSIPGVSSGYTVAMETEDYDTDGYADLGTDATRLTIPSGVNYASFSCFVEVEDAASSEDFAVEFILRDSGGTLKYRVLDGCQLGFNNVLSAFTTPALPVAAGDYGVMTVFGTGTFGIDTATFSVKKEG